MVSPITHMTRNLTCLLGLILTTTFVRSQVTWQGVSIQPNVVVTNTTWPQRLKEQIVSTNAYYQTGLNCISIAKNQSCTMGSTQFIAFIDKSLKVNVAQRNLSTGVQSTIVLTNTVPSNDEHEIVAIALDAEGYLHLAYGMHATPIRYCKSTAPMTATFGATTSMLGTHESQVTYPMFIVGPVYGDLYFTFRDGGAGNGDQYFYAYNTNSMSWAAATGTGSGGIVINGKATPLSAYLNGLPKWDNSGTNLWWNWTFSNGSNVYSNQYAMFWTGAAFKKFDGSTQTIPATVGNVTSVYSTATEPTTQADFTIDSTGSMLIPYQRVDSNGSPQLYVTESSTGSFVEHQLTFNSGTIFSLPPSYPTVFTMGLVQYLVYPALYQGNPRGIKAIVSTNYFATFSDVYVSLHYNPNWALNYDPTLFRSGLVSFAFMDADDSVYGQAYLQYTSNPNLGYFSQVDWIPGYLGLQTGYPSDLTGVNSLQAKWINAYGINTTAAITTGTGAAITSGGDVFSSATRYVFNGQRTGFGSPDTSTFQISSWNGTNVDLAVASQYRVKGTNNTAKFRNFADSADIPVQSSWHVLSSTTSTPTGAQVGTNGCVIWCSNAVVYATTSTDGSTVSTKQIAP